MYNPRCNVLKLGRKGENMNKDFLDKDFLEKYGPVLFGWSADSLIIRLRISTSHCNREYYIGDVILSSGGRTICCARLKSLYLAVNGNRSWIEYGARLYFSPKKCFDHDTFINVKIGDMESGLIPVGVPVNLPK